MQSRILLPALLSRDVSRWGVVTISYNLSSRFSFSWLCLFTSLVLCVVCVSEVMSWIEWVDGKHGMPFFGRGGKGLFNSACLPASKYELCRCMLVCFRLW
jgi:hypothetical protein